MHQILQIKHRVGTDLSFTKQFTKGIIFMKKTILAAFVAGLLVCACSPKDKNAALETSSDKDTLVIASEPTSDLITLTIASKQADCTGVGKQKCLLVKEDDADDWIFWYSGIEGFTYEEGYEYVLEVSKVKVDNVPADASSLKYVLMREVSKTKKESEDMPQEGAI